MRQQMQMATPVSISVLRRPLFGQRDRDGRVFLFASALTAYTFLTFIF